jgi:UDP-3-O-[3-hydroxymyristoyl] glucosamine N-acyltransferase
MNERLKFAYEQMTRNTNQQIERTVPPEWVEANKNSIIMEGVYFPTMGFGYEWDFDLEKYIKIIHTGKVLIHENVIIHSGANIVRGTGDSDVTEIGEGTKIDYGVHIAHNVKIGKNCLIVAGSIIGGSVTIGDNCFIGIGAMIKNKIRIGNNVIIGMGAVVIRDIPDNETWVGNPAHKLEKI